MLDLVRIVQEALANMLKHSGAKQVWVDFDARPGGSWQLGVRDDGCGYTTVANMAPPGGTPAARGITNMRRRAARLGASLALQANAPAGLAVVVSSPAHAA
jgi:signal transduction histidine kinase